MGRTCTVAWAAMLLFAICVFQYGSCNTENSEEETNVAQRLEKIDMTNATPSQVHERKRRFAQRHGCPVYSQDWLTTKTAIRDRSLSPWKFVWTFDSNRKPRHVLQSVCLCEGCIDPETGRETQAGVRSVPLMRPKAVRRLNPVTGWSGPPVQEDVELGCHCVIQKQI